MPLKSAFLVASKGEWIIDLCRLRDGRNQCGPYEASLLPKLMFAP